MMIPGFVRDLQIAEVERIVDQCILHTYSESNPAVVRLTGDPLIKIFREELQPRYAIFFDICVEWQTIETKGIGERTTKPATLSLLFTPKKEEDYG